MNKLIRKILSILKIRYLEILYLAPPNVVAPDGYRTELLDERKLRNLSALGLDYGSKDIRRIAEGVAICIAVYFNEELAGLCWYAIRDYLHSRDYIARVNPQYICGYGLRILPRFQKKGIRLVLANAALKWVFQHNREGLIAAIDFDNSESIRSVKKMNYKRIGFSYCCRWLPISRQVKFYYHLESQRPNLFRRSLALVKKWGLLKWLFANFYSFINRFGEFRVLQVNLAHPIEGKCSENIKCYSQEALRQIIDPSLELDRDWIEYAITHNQSALVLYGENVKGYYWLSAESVPTSARYVAEASAEYYYGFKGYTDSEHRGQGIFSALICAATQIAHRQGKKGVISHVELVNYSSRSAHRQAKAVVVGFHLIFKLGPIHYIYDSSGAISYGSRLISRR